MLRHSFTAIVAFIRRAARACRDAVSGDALPDGRETIPERRYRAAVAALPEDQRAVFTMHRVHDLTIVDIAGRLGLPTTEVEAHLAAALLTITKALDGD